MTKTLKPLANSSRNTVLIDYRKVLIPYEGKIPHKLLKTIKPHSGRNNRGIITARHRGGQHKRKYRFIERIAKGSYGSPYRKDGVEGKLLSIDRDPNRNHFISLVSYPDGDHGFITTPKGIEINAKVVSGKGENVPIQAGNNLPLRFIPLNTPIHNLELKKGKGGQLARSAGTYAEIVGKEENGKYVLVKLPSKEVRKVLADCRATIGEVGNSEANQVKLGKAGRARWQGKNPEVRGSAMNPCDHPHGGGEQKAGVGHPSPLSPWGWKTLGWKTRPKNKPSNKFIVRRREK